MEARKTETPIEIVELDSNPKRNPIVAWFKDIFSEDTSECFNNVLLNWEKDNWMSAKTYFAKNKKNDTDPDATFSLNPFSDLTVTDEHDQKVENPTFRQRMAKAETVINGEEYPSPQKIKEGKLVDDRGPFLTQFRKKAGFLGLLIGLPVQGLYNLISGVGVATVGLGIILTEAGKSIFWGANTKSRPLNWFLRGCSLPITAPLYIGGKAIQVAGYLAWGASKVLHPINLLVQKVALPLLAKVITWAVVIPIVVGVVHKVSKAVNSKPSSGSSLLVDLAQHTNTREFTTVMTKKMLQNAQTFAPQSAVAEAVNTEKKETTPVVTQPVVRLPSNDTVVKLSSNPFALNAVKVPSTQSAEVQSEELRSSVEFN